MAGDDQERFEDYLELERYIEDLQAGRVAHVPEGLTADQARIYRMAALFHTSSADEATPRPEFVAELQTKLAKVDAQHGDATKKGRPFFSKKPSASPGVSRRSLLKRGAATAVAAAGLAAAVGIDHAVEEHKISALAHAKPTPTPTWTEDIVPKDLASDWLLVTTLDKMGDQAVRFTSNAVVGYVIRNDKDDPIPGAGEVVAMSAACTHMGCIVEWQGADRKYHCPCHGGVFGEYGQTDNGASTVRYLVPLPRLDTRVDPKGNVYVRVPTQNKA